MLVHYYFSSRDLVCAFGTPWTEHELGPLFACAGCQAETARLIALARSRAAR